MQNFIDPLIKGYPRNVTLDMNTQVLGADQVAESYTIEAQRVGPNIVLSVSGSPFAQYNTVYFNEPANEVTSLTIRGGAKDNVTFQIDGPLDLLGPVLSKLPNFQLKTSSL